MASTRPLSIVGLLLAGVTCTTPPAAPPPRAPAVPARTESATVVTKSGGGFDPDDRDGDGIGDAHDLCPMREEDGRGVHPWDGCPDEMDPSKLSTRWGPPPRKAVTVTHDQIKIDEEILFAMSSATIDPASQPLLESIAQVLKDAPEIQIVEIAGHADDTGSDPNNKRLTMQRAAAVLADLARKGVVHTRLRSTGYSAYCPIDPGKDDAARAKNRRVEFRILRRAGKDLEPKWGGCDEAAKHGMKPPSLPALKPKGAAGTAEADTECSETNPKECKARCDFGEPDACITFVQLVGTRADAREVFGALAKACELGHLDACARVANAHRDGTGTAKDFKKALELDDKTCKKGGGASCTNLGLAYHNGAGTVRDEAKSHEAHRRGCDLGDSGGCEALGRAFWFGTGVKEDHAQALDMFVAACEIASSGCAALRDRIKDDPSALRSRERALVALHVACEQDGDQGACAAIQTVGEKPGEYRPAPVCPAGDFAACQAACKSASAGEACVGFGVALLYGTGVRRKPAEAGAIFETACREGSAKACAMNALVHESKSASARDERLAVDLYEMACTKGEASACVNRARMDLEGRGTYRDEAAAAKAFDAACSQGIGLACAHLSAIPKQKDPKSLISKACSAGFRPACGPKPNAGP